MISNAIAQTLTPVASVGGFDWWPLVIFGVVALVIAGLVFWHKRNPTQEAAALVKANSELIDLGHKLHSLAASAIAKLETPKSSAPTVTELPPAAPSGPTPEQLAAIADAQAALDRAKTAAGQA